MRASPNAYCTNLARWLDNLLKPHIPTHRSVKDSFEFTQCLPQNYRLVSYDVKSLFTNIPLEETINYICDKVWNFTAPVDKATLKELLLMACKNIVFSFDSKLFVQFDGMCIGSNLGPTIAAFTMHMIEEQMPKDPIFYTRYVDDVFAIFTSKEQSDKFCAQINKIHQHIQITQENECNNKLTFLDVEIKKESGCLQTCWNIKTTNTGLYTPKISCSPQHYKVAALRSLIFRAYKICSNKNLFD